MEMKVKKLKLKAKDYKHFSIVFLILSTYLYMGAVNNTYFQPSSDGNLLFYLSLTMIGIVLLCHYRYKKIKSLIKKMSVDDL